MQKLRKLVGSKRCGSWQAGKGIFTSFRSSTYVFSQMRRFASHSCCFSREEEEEARKAYHVLGVPSSTRSIPEVKKKYMSLVKVHHPDVSLRSNSVPTSGEKGSASNDACRMVEINNAYSTLSKFLKAGGTLPEHRENRAQNYPSDAGKCPHSNSFSQHGSYDSICWEDPQYVPFYEMMWEEMREGAAVDAVFREMQDHLAAAAVASAKMENQSSSSFNESSSSHSGNQRHYVNKKREEETFAWHPHSTWSKADQSALKHMYDEGKSFDFIGNALKKSVNDVIKEFNSWKQHGKVSEKRRCRWNKTKRTREMGRGRGRSFADSRSFTDEGMKRENSIRGGRPIRGPGGVTMWMMDDDSDDDFDDDAFDDDGFDEDDDEYDIVDPCGYSFSHDVFRRSPDKCSVLGEDNFDRYSFSRAEPYGSSRTEESEHDFSMYQRNSYDSPEEVDERIFSGDRDPPNRLRQGSGFSHARGGGRGVGGRERGGSDKNFSKSRNKGPSSSPFHVYKNGSNRRSTKGVEDRRLRRERGRENLINTGYSKSSSSSHGPHRRPDGAGFK